MSRVWAGLIAVLALSAAAPAHAWGSEGKGLPQPKRYVDRKDELSTGRLGVTRPEPRRVQGSSWGHSTFTAIPKSSRGMSSPHMRDY